METCDHAEHPGMLLPECPYFDIEDYTEVLTDDGWVPL